jgi:threonylcarbamoyladenosine tRNA methylthiotransferase MtaB
MTGFPGETDAEFNETVRFIEDMPFTYLHVFTYSERPGTRAAQSTDQVPVRVRRERTAVLRELSDRKNLDFRRRMIGHTLSAVTLSNDSALTSNFLPVQLATPRAPNELVDIEIGTVVPNRLKEREAFQVLAS